MNRTVKGFISAILTLSILLCSVLPIFAAGEEEYLCELRLIYAEDYAEAKEILAEGGAMPPQTEAFVGAFSARDSLALAQVLTPLEKSKRENLLELLNSWRGLLEQAFACRTGGIRTGKLAQSVASSRSSAELLEAVKTLDKAIRYTQSNVSPGAVCSWLQWNLK